MLFEGSNSSPRKEPELRNRIHPSYFEGEIPQLKGNIRLPFVGIYVNAKELNNGLVLARDELRETGRFAKRFSV